MRHPQLLTALLVAASVTCGCDHVGRSVLGGGDPVAHADAGADTRMSPDALDDAIEPPIDAEGGDGGEGGNPMLMCPPGTYWVNGMCVADPVFVISLTWDQPGNMDLHVVTPAGNEIAYFDPMEDDGWLTGDNRLMGPETVVWTIDPPMGQYLVCVVPFGITGIATTTVTITLRGVEVARWTSTRDGSMAGGLCSAMSPTLAGMYTVQ